MKSNSYRKGSIPFLPLGTCRGFDFHLALLHLVPVCAQGSSTTLRVTLHHCALGIFIGIAKDLLEERVEGAISPNVGILIGRLFLLSTENVGGDTLPIFMLPCPSSGLWRRDEGGGRQSFDQRP